MTANQFNPAMSVLSKAIAKAADHEEELVCIALIEHAEEDFRYFHIPGKEERLLELRNQLQAKHEENQREDQTEIQTKCGTYRY